MAGHSTNGLVRLLVLAALTGACLPTPAGQGGQRTGLVFRGASDASAAVAVDGNTLLVADDENNVLRVYRADGGLPVSRFDLTGFLGVTAKSPEADIEAAARIGGRVYWITSHGRNREGKWRPNRHRFFATEVAVGPEGVSIRPVGRPCTALADEMAGHEALRALCPDLAHSARPDGADEKAGKRLAPKGEGLNIEGLCADDDGRRLYVGLRNPLAAGARGGKPRALVVPLLNPAEVVEDGRTPRLGRPMLWDLGGLGVRDMVRCERRRETFVLAGPHDEGERFALYRWSGKAGEPPVLVRRLDGEPPGWHPEALVSFAGSPRLLLLSDDGGVAVPVSGPSDCIEKEDYRPDGTCLNKRLRDESRRSFRGRWITP